MNSSNAQSQVSANKWFITTHWSVVLAARETDSTQSERALEALCRTYWYPLYAYVRRQGKSPHDAQDLTQEFFARLLQEDFLKSVAPEKGRFRTFMLVALKRFLANEWDRTQAQKRGGGAVHLALDTSLAETRYRVEPAAVLDADRIYDRRWALTLIEQTMSRLREDFDRTGRTNEFERLKSCLTADRGSIDYAELSRELGQNEGALRVTIHRMRKRFRELFHEAIGHTVSGPEEIEAETRHLLGALSN